MDTKNAKSHVTLVAGLHIGHGALKLVGALTIYLAMRFAWGFMPEEDEIARKVVGTILSILPSVLSFFGVLDIISGLSLFSYKQWSRVLVIAMSVLNCLNFPVGTGIGIYSIWALMQQEVQEMFT